MVRTALHATAAACLLFFCWSFLSAQNAPPQHPPRPKLLGPAKWDPSPQEVSAAYWTLEPGWNTDLEMRNNLHSRELTITPVLRNAAGQELSLAPVTVAAQHVVSIDLRNLAQTDPKILNYFGSFGSVAFRFNGLDSGNLFGATIVRHEGQPIDFHFDADEAGTPDYRMGGIEGMWWLPAQSSTDYLILSNPSRKPVSGSLVLSSASANRRIPLGIGPGQTKRVDLRQALGPSNIAAIGGLTLSLPGNESLSATQIVFDEVTGLAAIMKLFDREPDDQPRNHLLRAPMMALSQPDPGLGFPNGTTLIPRIFLRNAGSGPTQVSLTVNWRSESKTGELAAPRLTLSPGEVKVINLADQQKSWQIPADATWGTVNLSYEGRRADLVAVAVSYDKDNRYGLQTPFSENISHMWAGGMWHVDPTHNTFITTGNAGSESTAAEVMLFYNGGKSKYRLEKMLSPGQQLWLDVGRLIHDQVPDSDGRTLAPDTMSGSYELRDLDHATVGQLYEGKLIIDKTYGHAAYGCGTCCGDGVPTLLPDPFGGPPGINNTDVMQSLEQCTGDLIDLADDAYNWNSTNTAVATLPTKVLHTVAVGSATGSGTVYVQADHPAPRCPMAYYSPTQPISVQPTISGPNTLWWFKGLSVGVSGYSSQVNLTASASSGSSYQWSIASGSDKVQIQGSAQSSTVAISSIGQSTAANDVSITVTVAGVVSNPFYLTVKAPYKLGGDPSQPSPAYYSDSTYAWFTDIYYTVEDNFGVAMPIALPVVESFGSVVYDYSGTNWQPGAAACLSQTNPDATFFDHIGGERPSRVPTPVYNPSWSGVKVEHWSQDWRVGACGGGPRVQSDTIQKWTDHALHTGIISPNP